MNTSSGGRRGVVTAIALLVALTAVSGAATALTAPPAQTGPGGAIVVEEGETSSGISTISGSVVVRGTVNGDINAVSGNVVVAETGTVTGTVNGAAGSLRIAGTVDGNVDFAGGNVDITQSAHVGGDVNLGAGTVVLAGQIDGDVTVGADRITVTSTAVIGGDLRHDGALTVQDGATIEGTVVRDTSIGGGMTPTTTWSVPNWLDTVYGFFANLLLGALLLLLFPRFSEQVGDAVAEGPLRSTGWGLLLLFGVPVLVVALAITLIGIPVALLVVLFYVLAIWVGIVYGEYAVGRTLLTRLGSSGRWKALLLGLLLFAVLDLVPILGGIAIFLVLLVGLGALGRSLWGRFGGRGGDEEGPSATDAPAGGGNSGSTAGSATASSAEGS